MSQRSTRDAMLVGAADILGERLAAALARVAELEAALRVARQWMPSPGAVYTADAQADVDLVDAVLAKGREG